MGTKKNLKSLIAFMKDNRFDTVYVEEELGGNLKNYAGKTLQVELVPKDKRKKPELWELPVDKKGFVLCVSEGERPCSKCPVGEINKMCSIEEKCVLHTKWAMEKTDSLLLIRDKDLKTATDHVLGKKEKRV